MSRDCDDRDLPFVRTVTPEDSVGGRRRLFRISLEHIFAVWTYQRLEFVGLETGVARIRLESSQGLTNRSETLREAGIVLKLLECCLCSGREVQ